MVYILKPTDFGGWGRKAGPYGGLRGVEFSARCPPPIEPHTRIVAVCGINDFKDASSPGEDGWFHSDFYLFHHLFSDLSSNQVWLTCMDPVDLVIKYKEFVHGNRLETSRVVLDAEMLPDIQRSGNIRVITPKDLLERFLATVRSECRLAALNKESVLILIFGHGDQDGYGVSIGGKTDPIVAPRLTVENMKIAIGETTNVALLMTSCFSGGWVIKKTQDGSKAMLNASVMAAAGPTKCSESWAKSESIGRASGSIYASALLKAAIQMQFVDEEEGENEEEIRSSSAYVEWTKFIHDIGRNEVDRLFWKHDIKFAAQNDAWDSEWKTVSGLPNVNYKAKWDMLRTIPIDRANPLTNRAPNANFEFTSSMATPSVGEFGSITLGQEFQGSFANIVRDQALQYLNSFPGNDASGCNSHHVRFQHLVQGGNYDREYLEILSNILCYRMSVMKWATDLKDYLGLPINDGHLFDTWAWEQRTLEACNIEEWKRYSEIHTEILDAKVFESPSRVQGFYYSKPSEYLAIGFYESNRPKAQILNEIEKLVALKKIMFAPVGRRVLEDPVVQGYNNRFFRTFNRLGKKLRSLSPSKKKVI